MWRVLVVEDDSAYAAALRSAVVEPLAGRAVFTFASDISSARQLIGEDPPDLLILDMCLPLTAKGRPDPRGGIKLLSELPTLAPGLSVTVLSGQDRRQAVELLLSRRVDGYLFKDFGMDEIRAHLDRTLAHLELRRSNRLLKEGVDRGAASPMVAVGPAMQQLVTRARQVAARDTSVLIHGESGTGKEVLARFIHRHSNRAAGPFVALSCGAIPESLAEAELFGAVKGAYTGLENRRDGVVAQARSGTLFLDEIGELPLSLQPKLLRALQERTFRPLGADREEPADFRLITATHRDLGAAVVEGRFREDLLFRIQVFPLVLPPLRERLEDLSELVSCFVGRFNGEMGRRLEGVTPEAMERLREHRWPGNIRELCNAIEYAFVVETENRIGAASLPAYCRPARPGEDLSGLTHARALESFERQYLETALARAGWHIGRASEAVGLPRRTLQDRMARLGIRIRDRTGQEP